MNARQVIDAVKENTGYADEDSIRDSISTAAIFIAGSHKFYETATLEVKDNLARFSNLPANSVYRTIIARRNGETVKSRECQGLIDTLRVEVDDGPIEITYQYIPHRLISTDTEIHLPDHVFQELVNSACFYEKQKHTGRPNERAATVHY